MTEQEFDNIIDENLWATVFEKIYDGLPEKYYEVVMQIETACQAVLQIWWLVGEVENGGFDQYYFNTDGKWAMNECEYLLPTLLKLVGADTLADICQRANRVLNENADKVTESFSKANFEKFDFSWESHMFDSFDEEFYENTYNLEELMIQFIRKNKQSFVS